MTVPGRNGGIPWISEAGRHKAEGRIMSPILLSLIAFACVFGGTFLGMFLRKRLPGHHLSGDTKDVVRLGTGLIGTMAALVLGLLIASANSTYETQSGQVRQLTAVLRGACRCRPPVAARQPCGSTPLQITMRRKRRKEPAGPAGNRNGANRLALPSVPGQETGSIVKNNKSPRFQRLRLCA
jgi:hypothetical protein